MKKFTLLMTAAMMMAGMAPASAEVIFVKPDASGLGTSWDDAASLEEALSWVQEGDEIYVAKGTYTGSFKCSAGVTVYGECEGNETVPPTVTSAEGLQTKLVGPGEGKRTLYLDKEASTWIGFDISGGDASTEATGLGRGGGVYVNNGGSSLFYCNIHDNIGMDGTRQVAKENGNPVIGVGGGAYIWNGHVINCIIENNIAVSSPWMADSKVWSNGVGGGIVLDATVGNDCAPEGCTMQGCIIRGNSTTPEDDKDSYPSQGGGAAVKSGTVVNCLVIDNHIYGSKNNQNVGGGLACTEKHAEIINCTFVRNTNKGLGGGLGFQTTNASGVNANVSNVIAWFNVSRDDSYGDGNDNVRFGSSTDTALEGKITIGAICVPEATVAEGAITEDPMFADSVMFQLQAGSPAIDAGDEPPVAAYKVDLLGNARFVGDAVDLGCYEFQGADAIKNAITKNDVVAVKYFSILGREMAAPEGAVTIVKEIHRNGTVTARKVLN